MGDTADADDEIRQRARGGDARGAAALLAETYKTWLRGFVRRRVPPAEIDDVCGKVWEVVATGVPADLASPRGWLAGIAFHKIGHALRMRSFDALDSTVSQHVTSIRGKLIKAEQIDEVRRAIAALPPEDRELLHLMFTDGLKPAEIVAATGRDVSAKTLSTQIARLVDKLRDHVKR